MRNVTATVVWIFSSMFCAMAGLVPVQEGDYPAVLLWEKPLVSMRLGSEAGQYVVYAKAGEEVSLGLALGAEKPGGGEMVDVVWKVVPEGESGEAIAEGTAMLTPENAVYAPSGNLVEAQAAAQALGQRVVFRAPADGAYRIEIQASQPVRFLIREDVGERPHGVLVGAGEVTAIPTWVQSPAYFYVPPGTARLHFTANKARAGAFHLKILGGKEDILFEKTDAMTGATYEVEIPGTESNGRVLAIVSNVFIDFQIPEAGPVFSRDPAALLVPSR